MSIHYTKKTAGEFWSGSLLNRSNSPEIIDIQISYALTTTIDQ